MCEIDYSRPEEIKKDDKVYRKCKECKQIKELNEENFIRRKGNPLSTKTGTWRGRCRDCFNKNARKVQERTQTEKEIGKRHRKKYRKEKPFLLLLKGAKARSKKRGFEITITEQDLENLWSKQSGLDYYTGEIMLKEIGFPESVSLDRMNTEGDYTLDNIALCRFKTNVVKNDLSSEKFISMAKLIVENHKI